tara:strand:- start:99 stop:353 length:255 start_codon:yes stop_codon:yes gene_type:complete
MIRVKINPDAPTKHPATIRAVFVNKIPASAAAIPDREFSNEITTGISPPPIGITKQKPERIETTRSPRKTCCTISKPINVKFEI